MHSDELGRLRVLIGRRVSYRNHACRVIEILDTERALVLRCEGDTRGIQANQFGEANRRVQECITLPLFDHSTGELLPVVEAWLTDSN